MESTSPTTPFPVQHTTGDSTALIDETVPLLPPPPYSESADRATAPSSAALQILVLFIGRPLYFASLLSEALIICNIGIIFYGVLLVTISDSWGDHPPESTLGALLYIYGLHLQAACLGTPIFSLAISFLLCLGTGLYVLCTEGFSDPRGHYGRTSISRSGGIGLVKGVLIFIVSGTATMATGVYAMRWWNGGGIDEVTDEPVRSIMVAFIGYTGFVGSIIFLSLCMII